MRPVHSPSIRSRYDYFYNMLPATMAQGGTSSTFFDNQQADLFGDPIPPPPPTGFVDNYDAELYDPGGRSPRAHAYSNLLSPSNAFAVQGYTPVPRSRSAMGYEYSNSPRNRYNLQMESSPKRGSSTDIQQPAPPAIDDWRDTFPRPKSSINRTSTSGTISDRSPGDYSTPRLLSANQVNRSNYEHISPLPLDSSLSTISTANVVGSGFARGLLEERDVRASALRRSREPSPVTVVTDFITTGPYRLSDTRTSNKKPAFSILLDNSQGVYFKHLSHSHSHPHLFYQRPHSEEHRPRRRHWTGSSMSSSSSRETSPTKLYYTDHRPHSTLYRPATTTAAGLSQHHRFVGGGSSSSSVHNSVPDLYSSSRRASGIKRPQVRIQSIPASSRSKRKSFETLPGSDNDLEAYEISTDVHHKTMIQIGSASSVQVPKIRVNKSYETLSNIVRNEVGLSASLRDLQRVGRRRKMPPIKTSKGVMQVLSEPVVTTKIPRRQSVSSSSNSVPFSRTQARASRRGSVAPVELPVEVRSKTPTPRRQSVSRPTTLSPIIGTPNRDSELSAASRSSGKDLIVPDSPSRIPIRSRSSSRSKPLERGLQKSPLRRESKPMQPSSILRKTPISVTSNLHRANTNKKNIPVFGSLRKGGNKVGVAPSKNGPKKPGQEKKTVKRNSSLKSETSTEEKASSRAASRQSSSPDKKTPSPAKREPSPAISVRGPSPSKREASPSKRESSPEKRSPSPEKSDSPKDKKMKRLLSKDSFQSKSSDSIRRKVLEKKNSFKKQQSNPDLIKLAQKKSDEDRGSINSIASAASILGVTKAGEKFRKLVPLTKQNVVSMTTAAVVSQPAQIQTALTNQLSQSKLVDSKRSSDESTTDPAAIIEHSQKTLESIQKTMSDATDEINKTIEENLSHLKGLETAISDSPKPSDKMDKKPPPMLSKDSKPSSSRDLLKKRMESGTPKTGTPKKMPKTPTTPMQPPPMTPKPKIPVEPTVNVIEKPVEQKPTPMPTKDDQAPPPKKPEMELAMGKSDRPMMNIAAAGVGGVTNTQLPMPASSTTKEQESKQQQSASGMQREAAAAAEGVGKSLGVGQSGAQTQPSMMMTSKSNNHSGKGEGSSVAVDGGSRGASGSNLAAGQKMMLPSAGGIQQTQPKGSKLMRPNFEYSITLQGADSSDAIIIDSSAQPKPAASGTTLAHVDERPPRKCCKLSKCCDPCCAKLCCSFSWCTKKGVDGNGLGKLRRLVNKLNCCCKKKETEKMVEVQTITQMNATPPDPPPGCCRSFWSKMLCCRSKQKVSSRRSSQMILGNEMETTKCCFCIPCRKKRRASMAWSEDRQTSNSSQPSIPPQSFCGRMFQNICCCFCCRRKKELDSRRTSLQSKKASLDGRPKEKPKLDHALIEHNSMMKAALPALPICLAYFCLVMNVILPGLGTIFAGLFCVCFGKPRFSQFDGAKPRLGSFLINTIVGFAQAFCVIFCLVGWGWSIWWGMILLKTAQKLRRIRKAERITADVNAGKKIDFGKKKPKKLKEQDKNKDVEAGVK